MGEITVGDRLSYDGYSLVFEDHFDAAELDRNNWNVELHEPGWVNEEWQRYVDSGQVITLKDSKLLIRSVKTVHEDGSSEYISGRISTEHKHDFTYGIFEARLKVPEGKGYLPAFWLLAADEEKWGRWPTCGEIDIMEILGDQTKKNHGTIHYGCPHEQSQGTVTLNDGDFSRQFHDFALEWLPGLLRWYVDGTLFYETREWFSARKDGMVYPYPAPFDHDMFVILNLAVGGSWVGYPDETTDFENAVFAVDYVRVYQKTALRRSVHEKDTLFR